MIPKLKKKKRKKERKESCDELGAIPSPEGTMENKTNMNFHIVP